MLEPKDQEQAWEAAEIAGGPLVAPYSPGVDSSQTITCLAAPWPSLLLLARVGGSMRDLLKHVHHIPRAAVLVLAFGLGLLGSICAVFVVAHRAKVAR